MPVGKKFTDLNTTTDVDGLLGAAEKADGTPPGYKFSYSTDATLGGVTPSNAKLSTQKAVKAYADGVGAAASADATSKANSAQANAESYADNTFLIKEPGIPSLGYIPVVDNTGLATYQDTILSDGATVDVTTNSTTGVKTLSLNSSITNVLPTTDEKAAMDGANAPGSTNVFATINDLITDNITNDSDIDGITLTDALNAINNKFTGGLIAPNGFPNKTDSEILYDYTTRTITLQPKSPATSFDYYLSGVKHTINIPLSFTHANATGTFFFYVDSTSTFRFTTTPWNVLTDALISFVAYDPLLTVKGFASEERHSSYANPSAHQEFHEQIGTYIPNASDFAIADYQIDQPIPVDADNTFSIAEGLIADEDNRMNLDALAAGGPYNVWYRNGSFGQWIWNPSESVPFLIGTSYVEYNQYSGGVWQLTELTTGQFINLWVFKCLALDSTFQTIIFLGQNVFTTLEEAIDEPVTSLQFGNLPFQEIAPLYQITLKTDSTYPTNGKCSIASAPVRLLGSRVTVIEGSQDTHNALVGLQGGTGDQRYHTTADEHSAIHDANLPGPNNTFVTQSDLSKFDFQKAMVVTRFGNDLAELNYPTGSGTGFIVVAADFPATFVEGDCYMIKHGVTVTDNDPTKTNTGQTFTGPIQISADATNNRWIPRDGHGLERALCTVGAAMYMNYFASSPYPPIWVLDNATYYFPTGSANYSSVFAPFATFQISGWHYIMRPISIYVDTAELNPVGIDGCIMLNTGVSNAVAEYHGKYVYTNSASLTAGIFRNVSGNNSLLEVYCGDLLTPSSTQSVLVSQGGGNSRVSAYVNGKIKGKAVTLNSGVNIMTICAGDKTELTTLEAAGDIYVMANLDDVAAVASPVNRVSFGGNTFVQPITSSDGYRTTFDMVAAYAWFNSIILGNDGTYHGTGIFGRAQFNNGSGVKTAYITSVGGEDNLLTQPLDIRGGFKDISLNAGFTAIKLADSGNQSFTTTNKTIVGAVNEINAIAPNIAVLQKDKFTTTAGQTVFTISSVPKTILGFCYKGVFYIDSTVDYTYSSGTSITWNNPGGITFALNDVVFIVYNK